MMKRLFLLILTLCLLVSAAPGAYATETTEATEAATEETIAPSFCGEELTWTFTDGVLTVTGTGVMDDMSGGAPWEEHKDKITSVVLTGGVTTVGAYAFQDYDGITSVDFGDSLKEIDTQAFQDCDGLTEIYLPATFRRFGKACFQDCSALTKVHCAGSMPSFNANCLWNGKHVTVYCPANNPWPEQYVQELETNFGGRLEILAETGEDPFDFTEATEAAETTEATEATEVTTGETEETAAAATEAEAEPVTEETTAPATDAEPAPTQSEETVPETTEPALPEKEAVRTAVLLAIGAMAVSAVGIIAILILLKRNKGGKYSA